MLGKRNEQNVWVEALPKPGTKHKKTNANGKGSVVLKAKWDDQEGQRKG